jgi:hypothetical protein
MVKKMPLVVINGNLNAVQYRNRILSTVVPYVQQNQLTLYSKTTLVCKSLESDMNICRLKMWIPLNGHHTAQIYRPYSISGIKLIGRTHPTPSKSSAAD